ncbi:MAG: hypothetical protein IJ824_03310 [Alphaproteobacteria bacterium]|nr:hypothetical protein [Alphaproteobacteria bacterium]
MKKLKCLLPKRQTSLAKEDVQKVWDSQCGLHYALYHGEPIGIILGSDITGDFVLALHNACTRTKEIGLSQAQKLAAEQLKVGAHSWIVPTDVHLSAIKNRAADVNRLLVKLDGQQMTDTECLSATKQKHQPAVYNVRFVLPL